MNNVSNPNYSILNAYHFFGGSDPIRIVILVYIFLSLILNVLNLTVFFITMKKVNRAIPLANWIMITVLIVNFIHTFSYFFEWVIKEGIDTYTIEVGEIKKFNATVGALLVGNPNKMPSCNAQGFLLISSSISQDFLINIFFYMVSSSKELNEKLIKWLFVILGIAFPFIFTLVLLLTKALGINDQFCYVNKYEFKIENDIVKYHYYDYFQIVVMTVYFIRVVNFVGTIIFLVKIIKYIKNRGESKLYLFKSIFIPIIQLFTIWIGVIYRVINIFSPETSVKLSSTYLILNTSDGVLFPVGFFFQFNIFEYSKKLFSKQEEIEKENLIEFTDHSVEDE